MDSNDIFKRVLEDNKAINTLYKDGVISYDTQVELYKVLYKYTLECIEKYVLNNEE